VFNKFCLFGSLKKKKLFGKKIKTAKCVFRTAFEDSFSNPMYFTHENCEATISASVWT